jgi:hypothetical protein
LTTLIERSCEARDDLSATFSAIIAGKRADTMAEVTFFYSILCTALDPRLAARTEINAC